MDRAQQDPFPIFLSAKQAASALNVTPRFVYHLLQSKKGPPVYKLGKRLRFKKHDLLQWMESNRKR